MLTEEVVGKSLDDVREMSYQDVIEDMGRDVVSSRTRCATLALSILKNAVEKYEREQAINS
jgi:nitrogen fixation NifU-like protein